MHSVWSFGEICSTRHRDTAMNVDSRKNDVGGFNGQETQNITDVFRVTSQVLVWNQLGELFNYPPQS